MPIYAEQAVFWLWLIDPGLQTLEVYQRQNQHWLLDPTWQNDDVINAPPFADISLQLANLWLPEFNQPNN